MKKALFFLAVLVLAAGLVLSLALPVDAAEISGSKDVSPKTPNPYRVGDTIHYEMSVTNPSPSFSMTVDVWDVLPDGITKVVLESDVTIPAGGTKNYTLDYVVQESDVQEVGGYKVVINTLRAQGVQNSVPPDPVDLTVKKSSLIIFPAIDVTKSADPELSKAGDEVNYTITVTNTGDCELVNITVNDTILGDLSASYAGTLAAGASETHTFPYVVKDTDPDPLVNEVTVTGTDVTGGTVSDLDSAEVDLVHPAVDITKSVDPTTAKAGDPVTYTITVTNTGDCELVNITVNDTILGDLSASYADTLAAGASESHDFTYTIKDTDPDPLVNTVTVHANPAGLPNNITAEASAEVDIISGEATRTPGFWQTHYDYTIHVFEVHLGGVIDLGWKKLDSPADVFGMFWADVSRHSDGTKRSKLCQARVITSFQAVAAILNSGLSNGAPLPVSKTEIAEILGGTDIGKIRALGETLDAYNNSGDDVAIFDDDGTAVAPADPKAAKAAADTTIADCP